VVNSPRAARETTLAGEGIALCPDFVVGADLRDGGLVSLLEDFAATDRGIYALYPHSRYLAAKVRAFVDFLVACFADGPAWV